jgi:hypothetical protein
MASAPFSFLGVSSSHVTLLLGRTNRERKIASSDTTSVKKLKG